jgi:hypothetical protein
VSTVVLTAEAIDEGHLERQRAFSLATFGPGTAYARHRQPHPQGVGRDRGAARRSVRVGRCADPRVRRRLAGRLGAAPDHRRDQGQAIGQRAPFLAGLAEPV